MRRERAALVVASVACAPEGPIRRQTEQWVSGAMAPGSTLVVAWDATGLDAGGLRLALSVAPAHIPDIRGAVSAAGAGAVAPAVDLRDGRVAVAWNEPRRGDVPPAAVVHVGRILR
jgi:hypothetical protein